MTITQYDITKFLDEYKMTIKELIQTLAKYAFPLMYSRYASHLPFPAADSPNMIDLLEESRFKHFIPAPIVDTGRC